MQNASPLKKWRVKLGLDQSIAANKLDISQGTYSRIETMSCKPSPQLTLRIERITGIPKEVLRPDIYQIGSKKYSRLSSLGASNV